MTTIRKNRTHLNLLSLLCLSLFQFGCGTSQSVTFTNVSDSWLNVNYFVASPNARADGETILMVSDDAIQISPGQTVAYPLSRNSNYAKDRSPLVHIRVRPVTPSWEEIGTEYWMELLTHPPVTIVATGSGDRFEFMTGNGALALIPDTQVGDSRYAHKTRDELAEELAEKHAAELAQKQAADQMEQAQTSVPDPGK